MRAILLGGLAVILTLSVAPAQADRDAARVAKDIAAKEAQIKVAEQKLAAANRTLQDLYSRLDKSFAEAKSGERGSAVAAIRRVVEEPLQQAQAPGGGKKALERGLQKWLPKIEHELLGLAQNRTRDAVFAAFDQLTAAGAPFDAGSLAEATAAKFFAADAEFAASWNDEIAPKRSEVKNYNEAFKGVDKLNRELMIIKDPRMEFVLAAPAGMTRVPEGTYVVEGLYGFEKKKKSYKLKAFYIDIHEVTHKEYYENYFLKLETSQIEARLPRGKDRKPLWPLNPESKKYAPSAEMMPLPVVGLDAESALLYAKSQGKRLPTEPEWAAAASATTKSDSEYPWGNDYQPGRANDKRAEAGGSQPVDSNPEGRSAYGCFNMAGNVKEWCATVEATAKDFVDAVPPGENVVIRGGSFRSAQKEVSNRWRWGLLGQFSYEDDVGFRCAKDEAPSGK